MILIIINILQQFPDNASLHGHQTGNLYGYRYYSTSHLRCVQSVQHRQDGCSSRKE